MVLTRQNIIFLENQLAGESKNGLIAFVLSEASSIVHFDISVQHFHKTMIDIHNKLQRVNPK